MPGPGSAAMPPATACGGVGAVTDVTRLPEVDCGAAGADVVAKPAVIGASAGEVEIVGGFEVKGSIRVVGGEQ